jgi:hypothetical protein
MPNPTLKTHRLVVEHGRLCFPTGDWMDITKPSLLMEGEPGDCDTCAWPMVDDGIYSIAKQRGILAVALCGERETNETFGVHDKIELPDGTLFDFDDELAVYEAAERERRKTEEA